MKQKIQELKNRKMKTLQDSINLIQYWRKTFGLRTDGNGSEEEIKLANKLIIEEYTEYLTAINENDKVEQLDALADLAFVLVQKANVTIGHLKYDDNPFSGIGNIPIYIFEAIRDKNMNNLYFSDSLFCISESVFGFGISFYDLIKEVYDSNMSKLCKDEETAIRTCDKYAVQDIMTYYEPCPTDQTKFIVYRGDDNKVLKSIDFVKPNIAKFLK